MKFLFCCLLSLMAVVAVAAVGGGNTAAPAVADNPTTFAPLPEVQAPTGSPAVYTRIATMTDCGALQDEFDTAERNGEAARNRSRVDLAEASTSYMVAAHARMQTVGCY